MPYQLPPPLDYFSTERDGPPPNRRWTWIAPVIFFAILVASMLIPPSRRANPYHGNWGKCLSNIHQIGLAIMLYQNDFGGTYPDTLAQLLQNEQITASVFICPSSNDTSADGPTTQALLADFNKPGHESYIYIGAGLNAATVTPDMIVLYEPTAIHAGKMNVLFGDGHADGVDATTGAKIIAAAATGQRVHLSSRNAVTITPKATVPVSPNTPFSPR
jgi:prepilin-type processing-associated H-X9-DG protein